MVISLAVVEEETKHREWVLKIMKHKKFKKSADGKKVMASGLNETKVYQCSKDNLQLHLVGDQGPVFEETDSKANC